MDFNKQIADGGQGLTLQAKLSTTFRRGQFLIGLFLFSLLFIQPVLGQDYSYSSGSGPGEYEVSFDNSGGSSVYELNFLVRIDKTGTADPDLSVSVPSPSGLFDSGSTTITVSDYSASQEEVTFEVKATRNDSSASTGSGHVLDLTVTGGIVIAIEDFPAKRAPEVSFTLEFSPTGTLTTGLPMESVRVLSTDGRMLLEKPGLGKRQIALPQLSSDGTSHIYILVVRFRNGQTISKKIWR